MALQDKYAELISKANSLGITNLSVKEQNNVLYIDGEVPNGESKDQLWSVYNKIDPDFRSGDLILNVNVLPNAPSSKYTVTYLSKYNDDWYLIRSEDGTEGYCNTEYLTAI